jgi:hypothetical protein
MGIKDILIEPFSTHSATPAAKYISIITMGTLKGNRRFLLMIHSNKSSTRMIRFTKEPKAFDAILAATKVGSSFEWPLMAHVSCISDLQDLETWRLAAQL